MAENDATQPDATEQEIEKGFKEESEEAQEAVSYTHLTLPTKA